MLDHGPNIKTYDSPSVREWEAWASLKSDLEGVRERAAFYKIRHEQDDEWTIAEASALWESLLVLLFRHYTNSVVPGMQQAFLDAANRTDLEREFVSWRRQRDKKVAHPIGHQEFYQVRVYLDDEGALDRVVFGGGRLLPMPDEVVKTIWLADELLASGVKPRLSSLKATIRSEVEALTPDELAQLSPYYLHAHGRRFGA